MALAKAHERCIRRHRKCLLFLGVVIFFIQVLIVCVVFSIDSDVSNNSQEPHDLSGKGRINVETMVEDSNSLSSRRLKETFLSADDEDINALYSRQKVPPDKNSVHGGQPNWRASALSHSRTSNSASVRTGNAIENNKTSLRLEELDFVPNCEINSREAVSAIHRAKTQFCKQEIANITCLINSGKLFPKELPSFCPSKGYTTGKPLGCYKDEKSFRILSGYYVDLKSHNSPQYCINLCLQSGFLYAGVQYSKECFCGNNEPPSNARLPDSSCNMKCPSDPRKACGGYYTIDVFQTGIAKFAPQVPNEALENPQIPVRIVYLLTLNGRAVRQVRRLIKALFHRDHYFYIHVDARQDYLYRELLAHESKFPNIRLARKRYATIWGGASLLEMLLSSMSELLKIGWDWDFVINLSESDFPIKTNSALVSFLSANKGYNFVKSHGREAQRFIQKQGLDKAFVECEAHMWRVGDRRLPWGIQVDGGSDWVALSRHFVEFVAKENSILVEGLLSIFKYTLLPAESFFHTALRNSRFCGTYIDNNLHVTNWKRRLGCKCQYKHVVDWCGCSPNVFKLEDWPRLLATETRQLYFARKFDPSINQVIIDKVEAWLEGSKMSQSTNYKLPIDIPSQLSYWQSVYHHADQNPPADDALLSLANSFARRAVKKLLTDEYECPVVLKSIFEVTSYHNWDFYMGSLVRFDVNVTSASEILQFETWVRVEPHFSILKRTILTQRLQNLVVSSEYDMKEQMARNFLRVLGPFSEPVLIANLEPNTTVSPLNLTFLWIDPAGHLAEVSEMHIEEGLSVGHIKLSLQQPLLPGSWEVRLVGEKAVVAIVRFMVTPQQFMSGVTMSQQQARFLHSGAGVPYRLAHLEPDWETLMNSTAAQRTSGERRVLANSSRFGKDLQKWVDNLSQQFYPLVDTCIISDLDAKRLRQCATKWSFRKCSSTSWSSLAPDPKSRLTDIDESTGRLRRW